MVIMEWTSYDALTLGSRKHKKNKYNNEKNLNKNKIK